MNIEQHTSHMFTAELEDIKSKVLKMGGLVEQQLDGAVQALIEGDSSLAEMVIKTDDIVNNIEMEIDQECIMILARRQPAASDLRLVMTVTKTIADLERIGDEAERIARMGDYMQGDEFEIAVYNEFQHQADLVMSMLQNALDAFARGDYELAIETLKKDKKVDQKYESITRQLISYMMEDAKNIPSTLNLLWSARSLERVGDRCQNICEYVLYLVKGEDVRHAKLADAIAKIEKK